MRQIQYLTQLLQQIIFKKKNNQHKEAQQQLQNAFQRLTKEHPKQFNELTLQETLQLFMKDGKFASELALAVADLLVEEGELLEKQSFSKSQKSYSQALLLYKKAKQDQSAAVPLDIHQKINRLENVMSSNQTKDINRILSPDK
ncbi:hypothetical protein [Fodinibius salsisoli]|uniref:Tetratricopeptide repeat-containing protein n=1 Tax=Fodinibius salsisoli TaxID=2820877 RepID=A0ABT3PMR1_9BACT|nr:hypothetical protein [Fodinibius salsisoli]MCW9707202.1 hypothetical protein [Fodinibius salsisoli]